MQKKIVITFGPVLAEDWFGQRLMTGLVFDLLRSAWDSRGTRKWVRIELSQEDADNLADDAYYQAYYLDDSVRATAAYRKLYSRLVAAGAKPSR